jgi:hypothetical protein
LPLREISRSEAIVVAELLAGPGMRRTVSPDGRVPRRTRQAIRQRIVQRGQVQERYVPDPVALGRPIVAVALAQPYTEMHARATAIWAARSEAVNVWLFPDTLLGVFLLEGPSEVEALHQQLGDSQIHRSLFVLNCDLRAPTLPVFFDFEAAWVRITGIPGTLAYPRSLPSAVRTGASRPTSLSEADRRTLRSLLSGRLEVAGPSGSAARMVRLVGGGRDRRLAHRGLVEFRSFLEPAACARWVSDFPETIALVRGELLDGGAAPALFRALVGECRVSPFLFATDGRAVLFGCLSKKTGDRGGTPSPRPPPMITTIRRFLRRIVVVREPLAALTPLVDHRYDRPFADPTREEQGLPRGS